MALGGPQRRREPAHLPRAVSRSPWGCADGLRQLGTLFLDLLTCQGLLLERCRGEHQIMPMTPALPLIPSGRRFTCLPSLSCAGTVLRALVASTPWTASGGGWLPFSAMHARGGLCMSGMGAGELCEGPCSFVHAVCVLASGRSRTCHCRDTVGFCGVCVDL